MAGTWTSTKFPQFEEQIRSLTEQHRELEDEPLHLAIVYAPQRDPGDIFLFEVIGGNSVSPDRELFEVTFASTPGFPMVADQRLHLILTNPHELDTALSEEWPSLREIIDAVRSGNCERLYADDVGEEILSRLCSKTGRMEGAACG